jgi:hypothetical protein
MPRTWSSLLISSGDWPLGRTSVLLEVRGTFTAVELLRRVWHFCFIHRFKCNHFYSLRFSGSRYSFLVNGPVTEISPQIESMPLEGSSYKFSAEGQWSLQNL